MERFEDRSNDFDLWEQPTQIVDQKAFVRLFAFPSLTISNSMSIYKLEMKVNGFQ
jgi:hypothetical protein